MKYQSKICIVGCGPAGMTASLFLSKWGIEHLLVEKSRLFPRDKVCGENFDGRVGRILQELSPRYLEEMIEQGMVGQTWRYGIHIREEQLAIRFPRTNPPKLLARRLDFDHYLYRQVQASPYVRIVHGAYINSMEQGTEALFLRGDKLEVETQLAILANGAQGSLVKAAQSPSMLFGRVYYRDIESRPEREIELYFFRRPVRGYLMICPLPGNLFNVEVVFSKKDYQKGGLPMAEILQTYIANSPNLKERFATAEPLEKLKGIALNLPNRPGHCADDHLLLAGANAFSVNPITGMGVGNAMTMGKLAAETARDCLLESDFSKHRTRAYDRAVRRKLKDVVRFNRLVNIGVHYIYLFEWLLPAVLRSKLLKSLLGHSDFIHRIFRPRTYLHRQPPSKHPNIKTL